MKMTNQPYVNLKQSAAGFYLNQSQIEKVVAGICSVCVLKVPYSSLLYMKITKMFLETCRDRPELVNCPLSSN